MKKIVAFISFFLMASCAGLSDFIDDLGNGYFYYGEGSPANYIFYGKKDGNHGWTIDKRIIYPNVSCYDYNKNHIVAVQNPSYDGVINAIMGEKRFPAFYNEEERKVQEQQADSILKSEAKYRDLFLRDKNYYIISKKNHQVYGPLSKEEYLNKREDLRVSEDLVLEEE